MADNRRSVYGADDDGEGERPMMCRRCGCMHMERRYYGNGKDAIYCRNCFSTVAIVKHEERV